MRPERKPLPPVHAVWHACIVLLREYGFIHVGESTRRESVYLRLPESVFQLRISTHTRSTNRRQQYPAVVHSLIFREPKSESQIEDMAKRAAAVYMKRVAAQFKSPR